LLRAILDTGHQVHPDWFSPIHLERTARSAVRVALLTRRVKHVDQYHALSKAL
jgi:hypothetical protein